MPFPPDDVFDNGLYVTRDPHNCHISDHGSRSLEVL